MVTEARPDSQSKQQSLIVGIGASAGGLAAFKTFFANMPADTGMTFVLVQHLAPDYKSMLVDLLRPVTKMPVTEAQDGMKIAENHVFVIPPNATLTFEDGALRVERPAPPRAQRRPIDTLFSSLAENHDSCAVGIVLSGVGSDGSLGLVTIKEYGGLTLAQAEFDHTAMSGMPSSAVATGLVDLVLPVEAMPAKLVEYQRHLSGIAEKKEADGTRGVREHLATITSLLRARISHDFSGYKEKTLTRRIQRRMQLLQIQTFSDYIAHFRSEPQEGDALFRELLIGVTEFFRDPNAFEALNETVIPSLLERASGAEPIRVWVPGCATGEEVYSIAILLREAAGQKDGFQFTIFGTDIDPSAIAVARSGRYHDAMIGLSPERLERWFSKVGTIYCPVHAIREMCVFSVHSIVKDPPFSRLDLISCRNLLIYLDTVFQNRAMQSFYYALRPGGYLFLGPSESVGRDAKRFAVLDKKHRILQRRDAGPPALPVFRASAAPQGLTPPPRATDVEDDIARLSDRVMQKHSPAYLVVGSNFDILRFSGAEAGSYLEPSAGVASLNLFTILHPDLRPQVRRAVETALATRQPVVNEDLTIDSDGRRRSVTLIVEPMTIPGADPGLCVIAFRERDDLRNDIGMVANAGEGEPAPDELRSTKAQLQAMRDELDTHVEETKSANEEYQSVNEELQSANEELETSKEEMQSVNEELQTLNVELHAKNDLLSHVNSDLQNLLDSTEIATIFLDDDLRVRSFTPVTTELFPLRANDQGRSITEIVTWLTYEDILADVKKVQRTLEPIEREVQLKDESRTFILRIRPYRTVKKTIEGVVMTFVNITERKRRSDEVFLLMREMAHRSNNLLAVIQAIARQSQQTSTDLPDFHARFQARLHSLGNSNNLLLRQNWTGATIGELVQTQLAPFVEPIRRRVELNGPPVRLKPMAVQNISLAMHELATNASKYGALSVPEGRISVRWELDGATAPERVRIIWEERDGPPVSAPERRGFGHVVIERTVRDQLDGTVAYEFAPGGVRWTLDLPATHIDETE